MIIKSFGRRVGSFNGKTRFFPYSGSPMPDSAVSESYHNKITVSISDKIGVGGLSNFPYFDYSNDVDDIFGWNAKEDDAVEWGESDHRGGGKSGDCLVFRVKVEGTEKVEGTARIGTVRWVSQFGLEGFSEGCYNVATYSGKAVPKMKDDDVVDNGYLNNTLTNSTHFEGNLTHFNSSMTKFNGTVSATVSLWNTTSSTNTIVPSDIENATLYMNKTNFDDFEEESLLSENHWNTTVPVHKDSDPDNQNHRVLRKKPLTDDAHSGDWQTSLAAIYVVGVTEGGLFLHDTPISFRPKVSGYMIKLDPETGEHTGHYLFQTSSDVRAISYPISIDVFRDGGDVVVASMVSSNDDRNGSAGPWRYGSDFGLKLERLATSRWDGSDFGPSELKVQWDVSFGDGENNFFPPPTWAPTSAPTLDAQNASKTIVLDSAEPKENLNISQSFQRAVASAFVRAVRVTPNGSTVVVAGTTVGHSSNYPQDSVNTTHGNQKGFILKIDGETGEYINGTDHVLSSSNSNFDEEISGICVTNNAIFVVGHSDISNSIDGRAFQEFVVKLDLEYLEVIWKLDVYGKTDSFGGLCSLSQDSKRVYVSGTVKYGGYLSTTDKYSTESFGADDIFVLSINADTGSLLFLEQIGSSFDDFVSSESFSSSGIMSDEKNNAIVVGNTIGSLMGHGIGSTDIVVMNLLDGTGESVSPWVENNSPTNYIISWPDLPFAAKLIILILTPIMAIGLIVLAYICGQRKTLDRYNALRDRMTVDDSASVYSMNTADFYSDDDKQKHLQFTCDDGELTISAEKDLDNCPQLSELDLLPHTNPREGGLPLILEHLPISLPSPTDSIISDENKAMSTCSSSGKVVTCTEDLSLI